MRYKSIYRIAKFIDSIVDHYRETTGARIMPLDAFGDLIHKIFPNLEIKGKGRNKISFLVKGQDQELVLKVGNKDTIENDHRAYKLLPNKIRRQYFARIFWHTKYCLLQKHGNDANASLEQLKKIREIMGKYGLIDIRCDNLKIIDGQLKVIDANIAAGRSAPFRRVLDYFRVRMPW